MTLWHADLNGPALDKYATVDVFNDHRVVRVVTSDQLSIETPDGSRVGGVVANRTGDKLTLWVEDGAPVVLALVEDDSFSPVDGGMFSRQQWVVQ